MSVKKNSVLNTIRVTASIIFGVVTFPFVSRIIGPEGLGKVNFATSVIGYLILVSSIGIPLYGLREVARHRGNKEILGNLIRELITIQLISSLIVVIVFLYFSSYFVYFREEKNLYYILSFNVVFSAFSIDWVYQGLEEYKYLTFRSLIISILTISTTFYLLDGGEDYVLYAFIFVLGIILTSLANIFYKRNLIFSKSLIRLNLMRHFKPLMSSYLLGLIVNIYLQLDVVMMGFLSDSRSVGLYVAALKLNKMLLIVIMAISGVLIPRLSYLVANDMKYEFDKIISKSFDFILFSTLPVICIMFLLSNEIITSFAGNNYSSAAASIVITSPIIFFVGLTNIIGMQILYPMGMERTVIYSVTAGAITCIVLSILLIPEFKHTGAAVSMLFSEFVVFIFQLYFMPIKIKSLNLYSSLVKYIFACIVFCGIIILVKSLSIDNTLMSLIISIAFGGCIYIYILYKLRVSIVHDLIEFFHGHLLLMLKANKN